MEEKDWPMKLPLSWHANPESIRDALAFIKYVAMSQTLLRKQSPMELQPMPLAFIRRGTRYMSVLILRP